MRSGRVEPDGQSVRLFALVIGAILTIALVPALGILLICLAAMQQQRRQRRYAAIREAERQRVKAKRDAEFYRYMRGVG